MLLVCGGLVNGPYALITTAVSADLVSWAGSVKQIYYWICTPTISLFAPSSFFCVALGYPQKPEGERQSIVHRHCHHWWNRICRSVPLKKPNCLDVTHWSDHCSCDLISDFIWSFSHLWANTQLCGQRIWSWLGAVLHLALLGSFGDLPPKLILSIRSVQICNLQWERSSFFGSFSCGCTHLNCSWCLKNAAQLCFQNLWKITSYFKEFFSLGEDLQSCISRWQTHFLILIKMVWRFLMPLRVLSARTLEIEDSMIFIYLFLQTIWPRGVVRRPSLSRFVLPTPLLFVSASLSQVQHATVF